MAQRFSKQSVIEELEARILQMEKRYGFHNKTGYAQVKGKDIDTVCNYGKYATYADMLEQLKSGWFISE